MKKAWLWLFAMVMGNLPSLAFADSTVHASGFLRPLILIIVIIIIAGIFLWAIDTWDPEMKKIWPTLPKLLKFIVCIVAAIWILLIIAALFGVHIT